MALQRSRVDGDRLTPEASPSSATADGGAIPTRQELADALLAPADLGDGWNRFPPEDTDLPVYFCSEADRSVYEDWDVYVGMYYPGSGAENRSPMVNQWQMAGEPDEMQDMYDSLATEIETCDGVVEQSPEPGQTRWVLTQVPALGDASIGDSTDSEGFELGDDVDGVASSRRAVILDGQVLMVVAIGEFREASLDAFFTQDDFDQVVTLATQRLPG